MLEELLWNQNYFWRGIKKDLIERTEYLILLENSLKVDFIVKINSKFLIFQSKFTDQVSLNFQGLKGLLSFLNSDLMKNIIQSFVVTKNTNKVENSIKFIPLYKILLTDLHENTIN